MFLVVATIPPSIVVHCRSSQQSELLEQGSSFSIQVGNDDGDDDVVLVGVVEGSIDGLAVVAIVGSSDGGGDNAAGVIDDDCTIVTVSSLVPACKI
mmetsp:Transcript_11595/g.16345  ORF Transcript_11595/g.16345 Transcript_11595/m.16345 type:complete len:96 (-) Transcript_11595:544-831(-)